MSGILTDRLIFEIHVERLLLGKPKRYQDVIQSHIQRHLSYTGGVSIDLDVVVSYMVQLDREYVSVREDNE